MYFVSSTEKSYGFIKNQDDKLLRISKPNGECHVEQGAFPGASGAGLQKVDAILGIIRLRMAKYVVVVTKSQLVGRIQENEIFKAESFDLLPLRAWRVKDENEQYYLELLQRHLNNSQIFFSPTWDLTNCFQRQRSFHQGEQWKIVDSRFFWNHYISQDMLDATVSDPLVGQFITPCIYGVVSFHETTINNTPVTFGIITRRSRFRAGTRYFRRGIDNDGNVANYNETEQILITRGRIYSFVQTRGSVPVYWGEINNLRYKPMLRVGDSPVSAAQRHFDEQVEVYGKNYLVNLVNQKGYEKPVKTAYENVVQALNNDQLDYIYFDFHHECSKMRWHRVEVLIHDLERRGLDDQGWYQATSETSQAEKQKRFHVESLQKSVVRTNCMDCLDRTNVVQSQLAKWVLQRQLETEGIVTQGNRWDYVDTKFLSIFRNTWADNADGVSCAYSGTGALKTDFTRMGRRTKRGALQDLRNSIVRYVKNNFYDGPRQDGFDLFLGNHLPYDTIDAPFLDVRPLWVQSVPYLILGSTIMITAGIMFPKEDAPQWVNRLFLMFWVFVFGASFKSLLKNGLQYVNWPRLCQLDFISESEHTVNGISKGWVWAENKSSKSSSSHYGIMRSLEEGKQE